MERLREILATFMFVFGILLIIGVCTKQLDVMLLVVAFIFWTIAYFLWPSKKDSRREDNIVWDILEIFIELPFDIFIWLCRFLLRIFRKADIPDIDM